MESSNSSAAQVPIYNRVGENLEYFQRIIVVLENYNFWQQNGQ